MKFCVLLHRRFDEIGPQPTCALQGADFLSTLQNFDCLSSWADKTCKTVRIRKRTKRSHLTSAGITEVRSTSRGQCDVEECVASVDCAARIREVNDKLEQVSRDNDALFRTSKASLLPCRFLFYLEQQF